MTSVYPKPTFQGYFNNYWSFIPKLYKCNFLFTLHWAFKLRSKFELFHLEIDKLETVFENNGHPSFVDLCIKKYLEKVFMRKEVLLKPSKKEFLYVLPFIGNQSLQLRTRLVKFKENKPKLNLKSFSNHHTNRNHCSFIKIPFRKISALTMFPDTHVVTSRSMITVRHTTIFLLELHSVWVYLI